MSKHNEFHPSYNAWRRRQEIRQGLSILAFLLILILAGAAAIVEIAKDFME